MSTCEWLFQGMPGCVKEALVVFEWADKRSTTRWSYCPVHAEALKIESTQYRWFSMEPKRTLEELLSAFEKETWS